MPDLIPDLALFASVPYQVLIDLYLADCVKSGRKLELAWKYWYFRVKKLDTVFDKWYSLSEMVSFSGKSRKSPIFNY